MRVITIISAVNSARNFVDGIVERQEDYKRKNPQPEPVTKREGNVVPFKKGTK